MSGERWCNNTDKWKSNLQCKRQISPEITRDRTRVSPTDSRRKTTRNTFLCNTVRYAKDLCLFQDSRVSPACPDKNSFSRDVTCRGRACERERRGRNEGLLFRWWKKEHYFLRRRSAFVYSPF